MNDKPTAGPWYVPSSNLSGIKSSVTGEYLPVTAANVRLFAASFEMHAILSDMTKALLTPGADVQALYRRIESVLASVAEQKP